MIIIIKDDLQNKPVLKQQQPQKLQKKDNIYPYSIYSIWNKDIFTNKYPYTYTCM